MRGIKFVVPRYINQFTFVVRILKYEVFYYGQSGIGILLQIIRFEHLD